MKTRGHGPNLILISNLSDFVRFEYEKKEWYMDSASQAAILYWFSQLDPTIDNIGIFNQVWCR